MVKKIPFLILLILLTGRNYAQQDDYFILIQADDNQPFFVHLRDKAYSSSAKGHLILSQLKEGVCIITIGFPGKLYPDQQFSIDVNKKDLEFRLKNLGDKGWNLFNPQTLELKPANKKEDAPAAHNEGIKKDDAFSRLMAGVVSDTAVMYNTYAMEQALKDSPVAVPVTRSDSTARIASAIAPPVHQDTIYTIYKEKAANASNESLPVIDSSRNVVFKDTAVASVALVDSVSRTRAPASTADSLLHELPRHKTGAVAKLSERKTTRGLRLVYADKGVGAKADTIVVIIPPDTVIASARHKTDSPAVTDQIYRPAPAVSNNAPAAPSTRLKDTNAAASAVSSTLPGTGKLTVVNSDCKNFATDYDVDKLRVKMLEMGKDEDRIVAAKKVFKSKCFTTNQIKALSEVFTSDAIKYRFFETAYPFVSDDHFRELSALLADPVYNGKFRAMTGQQ